MNRFEKCLGFVLSREGGLVNDKVDRGGTTNRGITQTTYDHWRVRSGKSTRSVAMIEDYEVESIYRDYWVSVCAEELPDPLDLFAFDAAVQHSPRKAVQLLQRAIGVSDTGYFGGMTRVTVARVINDGRVRDAAVECLARRRDYYAAIIAANPSQQRFASGWANRMAALEVEMLGLKRP